MTGSKHELEICLDKDVIAMLSLDNDQLHWRYTDNWQKTGYPVSPHLPLIGEISSINVQRFVRNLLPEGAALEELINTFHLSRYNTFGLVRALGLDTPGSLIFRPTNTTEQSKTFFRLINTEELEQRLNHRDEFSLIFWDGKPRLSVAGVQDKINVVVNEQGQLGFGEGDLCSTHILKFEKQKLPHLVLNEYVTLQLAKQCGLHVAKVQFMRIGAQPALLVERFDRQFISITQVKRRHIIDGCQALNMAPDFKYERNFGSGRDVAHIRDGVSLNKLFDFANQCENPILTKQMLLDWVLFNLLIFNCDAHGKNVSFYVGNTGVSLAPFYDLVNIKMYPDFEHELAMGMGDEFDENGIFAYQLADFADNCHLSRTLVANQLKLLIGKLTNAMQDFLAIGINDSEKSYLHQYAQLIENRCKHFSEEVNAIASIF